MTDSCTATVITRSFKFIANIFVTWNQTGHQGWLNYCLATEQTQQGVLNDLVYINPDTAQTWLKVERISLHCNYPRPGLWVIRFMERRCWDHGPNTTSNLSLFENSKDEFSGQVIQSGSLWWHSFYATGRAICQDLKRTINGPVHSPAAHQRSGGWMKEEKASAILSLDVMTAALTGAVK